MKCIHPSFLRSAALALALATSARASGVAALGDIACGVYTNNASTGIPYVQNDWLSQTVYIGWGWHTPSWWTDYGVKKTNASPAPDAAATMGQLKWCIRQTAALLDNVAMNLGGAGSWLSWTAANLPPLGNDEAVTVADFAELVEPVVSRVRELEFDSMYTPAEYFPGIDGLFDYGSHANEPVSLAHLKDIFNFDPDIDAYMDDIPDWWQRYYGLISWSDYGVGDPDADFDWDGLSDREEWFAGTNPTNRDSDYDGLLDGVDPDSAVWTSSADSNGNGLPDAFELFWFGNLDAARTPSTDLGDGFTIGRKMAAGLCPTNPAPVADYPADGLSALRLFPRFGISATSGEVIWERTFDLGVEDGWCHFFVSSSPDPVSDGYDADYGAWSLDGLALEWGWSAGGSGSASFSPQGAPLRIPAAAGTAPGNARQLTLRLRMARTDFVSLPKSLYLLSYTPAIGFLGLPSAVFGDALVSATAAGTNVAFSVDWSECPGPVVPPGDGSDEFFFDRFGAASVAIDRDAYSGLVAGGTLCGVPAGFFEIPFVAPPAQPPLRSILPLPPPVRRLFLAVLSPRLTFGSGHGPDAGGLAWDGETYSRAFRYPLDTYELWRSFHSDATGGYLCDCRPELSLGIPAEYVPLFQTNIVVEGAGGRETATATAKLSGTTVWTGTADHVRQSLQSDDVLSESDCACSCETCELDGDSGGSVRFRLSLGDPRSGQVSGFVWFRSEGPFSVTPDSFELLARSDAQVSDSTAGGVRTIVCSDARGRTVAIAPVENGVSVSVTKTATGEPDHSWTIVNENGNSARIRLVRTSRAGNVQSDRTYAFSNDGVWSVSDAASGTTETILRNDFLDDPAAPTGVVERVHADASGLPLSHVRTVSRRYGSGGVAVLREVERRENVGTPFEKAVFASYWEDGGARAGLPRLLSGDARAWCWTDYDAKGRPILAFDQRDGAPCPEDGTGWTLANHPASLRAFATEHSYGRVSPDDSMDPEDDATPRTTSRYVVDGASKTLVSRTWTEIVRGTTAGRPSVSVRTERAASQSATFGDAANAVSVSVSVDPEAPGVPLLLRGRPLSYTDEDGVTTAYEYAFGSWNPATRTFAPASGASHLRTRVFTTTPEAPNGVPLVSTVSETVEDATHGNEVWSATRVLLADGSLSEPFDWEARVYDDQDRPRSTLYADGSSSTNAYSCCRLLFTVGRDGRKTLRSAKTGTDDLYYAMEEVYLAELPRLTNAPGYGSWASGLYRTTQHFRDALGRETNTVTRIGSQPGQATNAVFSAPGDFTASERTEYWYGTADQSIRYDVRGNFFETEREEREGYVLSSRDSDYLWIPGVSDCRKHDTTLSYRGGRSVSLREEGTNWVRSTSFSSYGADGCRMDFSVTETSAGDCVTNSVSVSDFLGRTARVVTPLSDTAYAYDGASARTLSVADSVSGLSSLSLYDALRQPVGSLGSDGVSSLSATRYEQDASNVWWRVTETREAAGGITNLLSTVRERLTGLSPALCSETVSVDANGVATRSAASFDPATKIRTDMVSSPVSRTVVRKSMFGREIERTEEDELVRTYYDPFGRVFATRRSGGTGSGAWNRLEAVFIRNEFGDVDTEIRPVSSTDYAVTTRNFDSRGGVCSECDATGHGRSASYDLSGRLTEESGATVYPTKRSYDALGRRVSLSTTRDGTAWDLTRWGWDAATGLCTNKLYADGSRVAYAFDAAGRPTRTTLASGRWTQNAYDPDGRLTSVARSDGDSVLYAYDAFGRLVSATGAAGRAETFVRDALGRATNETQTVWDEMSWTNRVASIDRPLDAVGRPAGLAVQIDGDFAQSVCYDYGTDGRMDTITLTNAQGRSVSVGYGWANGRLAGWTVSDASGAPIFEQTFERDAWRPWLVTNATAAGTVPSSPVRSLGYVYDLLGRPVSRNADSFGYNARGEVTNATIDSAAWSYAYDHIGNRTTASDSAGTTAYAANALNQYTAVDSWTPSYDADGNLLGDGALAFAWDAAGRLTSARDPNAGRGDPWWSFEYDHRGRRALKRSWIFLGNWSPPDGNAIYFYDDWNLVHEIRVTGSYQTTHVDYVWGPDLSGTLQGAGGVGGLVAVSIGGQFYFPGYDNNGNVVGYWDESGSLVAEYAYDAFGNTISATGSMASVFPHRFSTKYYDAETDLYYYGYRYYSPNLGRWISRDPIEESGGDNLFCICGNKTLFNSDYLGLLLLLFDAQPAAPAGSFLTEPHDPTYEESILEGWKNILKFSMDLLKISSRQWDRFSREGHIYFNDIVYRDTRASYIGRVFRELKSVVVRPSDDSLSNYISLLNRRISLASESYDRIVFAIHSVHNNYQPTGLVSFMGKYYQLNDCRSAVEGILNKKPNAITRFVSCMQTFSAPKNASPEQKEAAMRNSEESICIIPAKGWVKDCFIAFYPFTVLFQQGPKANNR